MLPVVVTKRLPVPSLSVLVNIAGMVVGDVWPNGDDRDIGELLVADNAGRRTFLGMADFVLS